MNKGTLIRSACHQLHCWNTLGTGAHFNFLLGTLDTLEWMQNSWLHSQHKAKETLATVRTYPQARLAWLWRDESSLVRRRRYKEPFKECSTGNTHEHLTAWPQQFSQPGKGLYPSNSMFFFLWILGARVFHFLWIFRARVWPSLVKKGADSFWWLPWAWQTVVASTSTAALNSVFFSTELLHTTRAGAGTRQPGKYVPASAWP